MDNEALEIKIKAQAEATTQQLKILENQLKSIGGAIKSVKTKTDTLKGTTTYLVSATQGVKNLKIQMDELGNIKSFTSVTKQAKSLGSALRSSIDFNRLYLYWNLTKRLRDTLKSCFTNAVDYQETVNKFNVAMGSSVAQATKFQNVLNEAFGTARKDMMDYQATFKNILSGLGNLSTETTEKLSESLLQMGLDYSSLYNVEQSSAMSKFQAALTGSIRPIRSESGYDVSDLTIAAKAQQLGVDKTSKELTQMEKRMLRIIVLMEQMARTGAMQDLARTIESPSNQIKVLKNQVQELGIWLGNVFMGTLGSILPYVNGFIMVLKELAKMFAIFVGFKETSTGLGDAFEVAEDATDNISSGVGSAAAKAKELRKTLMGFDVLNVIQTPTQSSGGGGTGTSLGTIDPKILGALKEYDSLMSKVKMKATEIRDKIMDWLGFTKLINPLTGEISWKLREGNTWIEKIKNILKIIAGLFLFTKAVKLLGALKNIVTVMSGGEATTHTFVAGLGVLGKAFKGTKKWLVDGITQFKYFKAIGATTGEAVQETASKMFDAIPKAVKLGVGVAGLAVSYYNAYDAMRDFSEGTKPASTAFTQLGISIGGAAASGALIGSAFGPIGAAIGAIVGVVGTAITAMMGYETEAEKMIKQTEEFNKSIQDSATQWDYSMQVIASSAQSRNTEVDNLQRLKASLKECVDENGNLKKGYEDRAEYILNDLNEALGTEFKLNDILVGKYDTIIQKINETIKAKKTENALKFFEESWAEASKTLAENLNKQATAQDNLNKALGKLKGANYSEEIQKMYNSWDNLSDAQKEAYGSFEVYAKKISDKAFWQQMDLGKETKSIIKNISEQDKAYKESTKVVDKQLKLKDKYNQAYYYAQAGYTDELLLLYDEEIYGLEENTNQTKSLYASKMENIQNEIARQKEILKNGTEAQKEGAKIEIAIQEEKYNAVLDSLQKQTDAVSVSTPEIIEAWKKLATDNVEEYKKRLAELDPDIQTAVQRSTGVIVNELGNSKLPIETQVDEIKEIFNELGVDFKLQPSVNVEPKVKVKVTELKTKLYKLKDAISGLSGSLFNNQFTNAALNTAINKLEALGYAGGGFPDIGEMFIAREAGPELVGRIGNKNAVVNNQQIVEAVSTGVANAVSRTLGNQGNSFEFLIDGEQMTDVVVRRINRRANITGMSMGV